jgi:hypothetical protein
MDSNLIQIKPENYCINNFEFEKLYSDKLIIKNIAEFPVVLNIRSSDGDKLFISQKLIKMNSGQSIRVNFSLKVPSKISVVKDFFILFHNEMMDIKYYIHLQGKSFKNTASAVMHNNIEFREENDTNNNDNQIDYIQDNLEHDNINIDELIERNRQLEHMVDYYRVMLGPKQLEVEKCAGFEIYGIKYEKPESIIYKCNDEEISLFNKQLIQMRYDHYAESRRRSEEVLNILQNIIEENFKFLALTDQKNDKLNILEELIAKFIEGISLRINTENNELNHNIPIENIETLSRELERLERLSKEMIDLKITNLKIKSENSYLKNNSTIENKNSSVFLNKLKQLENDLEYFKKENANKINLVNNKDNLLYKKEEELRRSQMTIEKLMNRQTPQLDRTMLYEKDNIIKALKQHIAHRDKIIQSIKDREVINPNDTVINSLKLEIKHKDKVITELCGKQQNDINKSKY